MFQEGPRGFPRVTDFLELELGDIADALLGLPSPATEVRRSEMSTDYLMVLVRSEAEAECVTCHGVSPMLTGGSRPVTDVSRWFQEVTGQSQTVPEGHRSFRVASEQHPHPKVSYPNKKGF